MLTAAATTPTLVTTTKQNKVSSINNCIYIHIFFQLAFCEQQCLDYTLALCTGFKLEWKSESQNSCEIYAGENIKAKADFSDDKGCGVRSSESLNTAKEAVRVAANTVSSLGFRFSDYHDCDDKGSELASFENRNEPKTDLVLFCARCQQNKNKFHTHQKACLNTHTRDTYKPYI